MNKLWWTVFFLFFTFVFFASVGWKCWRVDRNLSARRNLMLCDHCETELSFAERDDRMSGGNFHRECSARMTLGSVGHQLGLCGCAGVTKGDPSGDPTHLSAREAAIASFYLNVGRHNPSKELFNAKEPLRFYPETTAIPKKG